MRVGCGGLDMHAATPPGLYRLDGRHRSSVFGAERFVCRAPVWSLEFVGSLGECGE